MSVLRSKSVIETATGYPIELIEQIQEGGQASVWKIRETSPNGRELAAKLVSGKYSDRSTRAFKKLVDDIENEIALLGELRHRFIGKYLYSVQHLSTETDCLISGFVMEMSPIGTIRDFLTDDNFQPVDQLKDGEKPGLIRRISQAVASVHDRGIIHSDIKAENVLIQIEDGQLTPTLIDFGGAFHVHHAWRGMRTERYSAPELEEGSSATIQSDIYALGVLVAEILVGKRLWKPTPVTIERSMTAQQSTSNYFGLVRRMLATDPTKRPAPETISKAFLNRESEHTISMGSNDREIAFPRGKYHWHPELHLSYNALKALAFLKSSNPTSDARLLRKVLDRCGFYGGSVHRVFGKADFYVEIWLLEESLEKFKEALQQFQAEQPHHHYEMVVEVYEMVHLVDSKHRIPQSAPEDLFGLFHERFEIDGKPNEIDKYIIEENDPDSDDIRFLLSMNPRTKLDSRQIGLLMELIIEYLDSCRHITSRQKNITKILGSTSDQKIVISAPVKKIRNYTDLMLGISRYLKKKVLVADDFAFDFSTFIDMDGNGFYDGRECYFSDDGLIPTKLREDYY